MGTAQRIAGPAVMTPEQIEKWARQASAIGDANELSGDAIAEFARLVAQAKDAEIVELKRLLTNAKSEAECMAFNFRVTNKAYIVVDQQMREVADELKRIVSSLPAAAQEAKP